MVKGNSVSINCFLSPFILNQVQLKDEEYNVIFIKPQKDNETTVEEFTFYQDSYPSAYIHLIDNEFQVSSIIELYLDGLDDTIYEAFDKITLDVI